jgi:hypothetical protein
MRPGHIAVGGGAVQTARPKELRQLRARVLALLPIAPQFRREYGTHCSFASCATVNALGQQSGCFEAFCSIGLRKCRDWNAVLQQA